MVVDYRYLQCFYHWGGVGVPVATHEWRFNRIPLKSGQALETDLALMPFQGLSRVDGVVDDVLGAISLAPAEGDPTSAAVRLQLASPLSKPATGIVRLRALPDGAWREVARVEARPGTPGEATLSLADLPPGGYIVNCRVQRDGPCWIFERPFTRGGARLAYRRAPREKRVGLGPEEAPALPRHDLSDAVVTPHPCTATARWADQGGGPRDDMNAREVIELKQRLDLDLTYVKFEPTPGRRRTFTAATARSPRPSRRTSASWKP